ncbi:MAG: 4-hydroxy-tetrahydrodipicolinate reductase [candidate division WOR-3 bacterium]
MSGQRIKVILSGALGRMGRVVAEAIRGAPDIELVGGIESQEKLSEKPEFPLFPDLSGLTGDVLVDFTNPGVSIGILEQGASSGMGLVVGTTGFTEEQKETIKGLANSVPVLLSPNMSVGINLLLEMLPKMAQGLRGYDIEITETHHRHKSDAPSGTAKALFEAVRRARPELRPITQRTGPRASDEVGIVSMRGGEVFGEHTVMFLGDGEVIEVTHRALSRKAFALGTLMAIRFVAKAKPGFYTMKEVIINNAQRGH